MREIRLLAAADWDDYVNISANAYPGIEIRSSADRQQVRQRAEQMQAADDTHLYGVFSDRKMVGLFRIHDFRMNYCGRMVLVGGLGGVAVDLAHKKRHIAYEIVQYFLAHYQRQGAFLTALYPFRPDFYRQMGFGYGRKLSQYRVAPAALPRQGRREQVRWLTPADAPAVHYCYQRVLARQHGMIAHHEAGFARLLAGEGMRMVGFEQDGVLRGYLVFQFVKGDQQNFLINDLLVRDLISEDREALLGLLAFLHTQADQVRRVIFNLFADDFHLLLADPRDDSDRLLPSVYHQSNQQGVGLMYRLIDLPRLTAAYQLPPAARAAEGLRLAVELTDSFWPQNAGRRLLAVTDGRLQPSEEAAAVTLTLDVAEFSSWLMGVTRLETLLQYGLARLSDPAAQPAVSALFDPVPPPVCYTHF